MVTERWHLVPAPTPSATRRKIPTFGAHPGCHGDASPGLSYRTATGAVGGRASVGLGCGDTGGCLLLAELLPQDLS